MPPDPRIENVCIENLTVNLSDVALSDLRALIASAVHPEVRTKTSPNKSGQVPRFQNMWVVNIVSDIVEDALVRIDRVAEAEEASDMLGDLDDLREGIAEALRAMVEGPAEGEGVPAPPHARPRPLPDADDAADDDDADADDAARARSGCPDKYSIMPGPVVEGMVDFMDVEGFPGLDVSDGRNPPMYTLACLRKHFGGEVRFMSVFPRQGIDRTSVFLDGGWASHTAATFLPLMVEKARLHLARGIEERRASAEAGTVGAAFGPKTPAECDDFEREVGRRWDRFAEDCRVIVPQVRKILAANSRDAYRALMERPAQTAA